MAASEATGEFRAARDFLLQHREDSTRTRARASAGPDRNIFNWALDWFDVIARGNDRPALWIVEEDGGEVKITFREMSERTDRVANWLRAQGVRAGDRVLLMLGNQAEQWECSLALMKLRAVVIPATPLLGPADLRDRIDRGEARHAIVRAADTAKFADVPGDYTRIAVGGAAPAPWLAYEDAYAADPASPPTASPGRVTR